MTINKIAAKVGFAILLAHSAGAAESGYVVHEWGTFTSIQGSDGVKLSWQAAQVSELPGFVYNWSKPGFNRTGAAGLFGKGVLSGQQRMETPVVYFYADKEQAVDVSVEFPNGTITEWYPQAGRIGPVLMNNAKGASAFGFSNSRIQWSNIKVSPPKAKASAAGLPSDQSGSHYYTARATDSAVLRVELPDGAAVENEKFLFYRGIGSFATPLQTIMTSANTLTLTNSGPESLTHLFVLTVKAGRGKFTSAQTLAAGKSATVQLDSADPGVPLDELATNLGKAIARALEGEGLFPREAAAMVATWKDSWFTEDGARVLYVLPSAWTDATLPMRLSPQPSKRVRVMVGRAEIITPAVETDLRTSLISAWEGDAGARRQTIAQLKKLGRFAEPALRLVCQHSTPADVVTFGYKLLSEADSSDKLLSALMPQSFE